MSFPSGRRSLLSRVFAELPIDSTVVLVALIAVLATGAGGMLLAAGDAPPSAAPTGTLSAIGSPAATGEASAPGQTTPPPVSPATSAPDPTAMPEPPPTERPTPKPEPEPTSEPPSALTGYVWPIVNARMSSRFGARGDGFVMIDGEPAHDGLDFASWCGDKVRAAHAGTVLYAGRKFDPFLGYSEAMGDFYARIGNLNSLPIVVVIDDGNGYRSVYVHLSVAKVGAGDVVKAGQTIGLEGATGRATGCHLHYSLIRMDGRWQDINPRHTRLYPPRARERVDPLLVFPLRHPDGPPGLLEKFGVADDGLPFDPPPVGAAGD